MSGRLKGLEDRAERSFFTSGPELPSAPATAELVERVMTLRGAMEEVKPMDRPVESAPCAPPRDDPRVFPFVPMVSESTMLGERAPPAGSMREEHVVVDQRNPTRETFAAARGSADLNGSCSVCGREDPHHGSTSQRRSPRKGTWKRPPQREPVGERPCYGDSSPSKIPTPWGSGGTGPLPM